MKKKIVFVVMMVATTSSLLFGCGGSSDKKETTKANEEVTSDTSLENTEDTSEEVTEHSSLDITVEELKAYPVTNAEDFGIYEDEDGTVWVDRYYGTDEIVSIPSEINGKTVSVVGTSGSDFSSTPIKALYIPGSVKKVREFPGDSMEMLVIDEGCEEIHDKAFKNHPLKTIVLPNSLKTMGKVFTFGYIVADEIVIPDNVETLYAAVFNYVDHDLRIVLGDNTDVIFSDYPKFNKLIFVVTEGSATHKSIQREETGNYGKDFLERNGYGSPYEVEFK